MGAVFDADASATKVAGDGAIFRNFDATPSLDIADNLATDNYFAGVNFRMESRFGADDKVMTIEGDRTFHDAIDLQIFRAGDFSFDLQAGTQSRGRAGRRNCRLFSHSLLFRPHSSHCSSIASEKDMIGPVQC